MRMSAQCLVALRLGSNKCSTTLLLVGLDRGCKRSRAALC